MRKLLHAEGIRERRVTVYQDVSRGAKRIVVQWRDWGTGARRYKVYPASPEGRVEAVAFAQGVADTLGRPNVVAPITVRQLWTAYAELELPKKKHRTQQMYAYRWRKWELFVGRMEDPNLTTLETAERFRVELSRTQAPNQVKEVLRVVKVVYNWGQRMEKLAINKLVAFRFQFAADEGPRQPPEYTPDEFRRLVATFGSAPTQANWRPFALIVIAGTQGPRIRALMHLRWDDVDLEGGRVIWTKRFDKTGRERGQPLVSDAITMLRAAWVWRQIEGYEGPWVFFSDHGNQGDREASPYEVGVYGYQSAVRQLHEAEKRAEITPVRGRGFHGLRKCAAGNALEVFGNPKDLMDWIGDTDPRRLKEYAKKRDAHQQLVAAGLSGSAGLLPRSYQNAADERTSEARDSEGVVVVEDGASGGRATGQI